MVFISNTHSYQADKYGAETILKETKSNYFTLESSSNTVLMMKLQQNMLESQERLFNLGFYEREETFWTYKIENKKNTIPDSVIDIILVLNLDTVTQYRSIYGFFDFLADVGGLLDLFLRFA